MWCPFCTILVLFLHTSDDYYITVLHVISSRDTEDEEPEEPRAMATTTQLNNGASMPLLGFGTAGDANHDMIKSSVTAAIQVMHTVTLIRKTRKFQNFEALNPKS